MITVTNPAADLNEAMADALAEKRPVYIPAGEYEIDSEPLDRVARFPLKTQFVNPGVEVFSDADDPATLVLESNPVEMDSLAPCMFLVDDRGHGASFENLRLVGEGRMRYGVHGEGWRNGAAIYSYHSDFVVVSNVEAQDWQTGFILEWGKGLILEDSIASGVNVSAGVHFNRAEHFVCRNFEILPYARGFPNPGIDYPEGLFNAFSMGAWITSGCRYGILSGILSGWCKNEAMIIEGKGISNLTISDCVLIESKWGFASRGMENSVIRGLDIRNCWRSGLMLNGYPERNNNHHPIRGNSFSEIQVHNCGNADEGRDNWPSIYEGNSADGNEWDRDTIAATFDDPGPWIPPGELISIKEGE